jgi:aminopeptidase-like protein
MTSEYAAAPGSGVAMHALIEDLFPICRSITGDGFRASLRRLAEVIPIELNEIPTGTAVLDWTIPKEWNVREAWIADADGHRVVDFRESNLHVVNYSVPVHRKMSLNALRSHLHTLPDQPELVPYRTSYYAEDWGFCLSQRALEALPEGEYDVRIDSSLEPGSLTYGECILPGSTTDEVLISVHSCHPSLANDNLSGMAVGAFLARTLSAVPRHHTFRFLFIPGTIGSIAWLATHEREIARIRHGLVLSCLGDAGDSTYKRSRRGNALVDRAASHVLGTAGAHRLLDFVPYGYDERQYCSPGFDLPVGCLTRTPNGRFPQYHTSADNLEFVKPNALEDSLDKSLAIVEILEHDVTCVNLSPKGEPQLGRRGLYRNTGGKSPAEFEMALLWVLNFSDGGHSLLDIADRAAIRFATIRSAANALRDAGLLRVEGEQRFSADTRNVKPSVVPAPLSESRARGDAASATASIGVPVGSSS